MTSTATQAPARIKPKLGRDDWLMRGMMVVIGLYLIVTLALPLYAMMSKSFSTYAFDLGSFAIQVDKGEGWGEETTVAKLNDAVGAYEAGDLVVSGDARLSLTKLFPDFSFRAKTKYRVRSLSRRRCDAVRLRTHRRYGVARVLEQRFQTGHC